MSDDVECEKHCTHDLPASSEHFPGSVCCWCGGVFIADYEDAAAHGQYIPRVFKPRTARVSRYFVQGKR